MVGRGMASALPTRMGGRTKTVSTNDSLRDSRKSVSVSLCFCVLIPEPLSHLALENFDRPLDGKIGWDANLVCQCLCLPASVDVFLGFYSVVPVRTGATVYSNPRRMLAFFINWQGAKGKRACQFVLWFPRSYRRPVGNLVWWTAAGYRPSNLPKRHSLVPSRSLGWAGDATTPGPVASALFKFRT